MLPKTLSLCSKAVVGPGELRDICRLSLGQLCLCFAAPSDGIHPIRSGLHGTDLHRQLGLIGHQALSLPLILRGGYILPLGLLRFVDAPRDGIQLPVYRHAPGFCPVPILLNRLVPLAAAQSGKLRVPIHDGILGDLRGKNLQQHVPPDIRREHFRKVRGDRQRQPELAGGEKSADIVIVLLFGLEGHVVHIESRVAFRRPRFRLAGLTGKVLLVHPLQGVGFSVFLDHCTDRGLQTAGLCRQHLKSTVFAVTAAGGIDPVEQPAPGIHQGGFSCAVFTVYGRTAAIRQIKRKVLCALEVIKSQVQKLHGFHSFFPGLALGLSCSPLFADLKNAVVCVLPDRGI